MDCGIRGEDGEHRYSAWTTSEFFSGFLIYLRCDLLWFLSFLIIPERAWPEAKDANFSVE